MTDRTEIETLPGRWYCVDKQGIATLCSSKEDAESNAMDCDLSWHNRGPYAAVMLVDGTELEALREELAQAKADLAAATALVPLKEMQRATEQQRAQMATLRADLRKAREARSRALLKLMIERGQSRIWRKAWESLQPASAETVREGCRAADPAGEDLCHWSAATGWRAAERHHGIKPAAPPLPGA